MQVSQKFATPCTFILFLVPVGVMAISTNFAVLFDLDGTLVDTKQLAMCVTSVALKQNGFDVVVDEKSYEYGARYITPQRLAWHATGQVDDVCGPILATTFENYMSDLVTAKNSPLYAGVAEILRHLGTKGITLGVLSNASGNYVRNVVNQHQFQDTFKTFYGVDDVPHAKPQPDGLQALLNDFQTLSSNCIYIGDSPTDGMAASAAGIYSIGVSWGKNSFNDLKEYFDAVVSTTNELQSLIDKFFDNKIKIELETSAPVEGIRETESAITAKMEPVRRVSWQKDVIDNEHMNKLRTDDEYWDGR